MKHSFYTNYFDIFGDKKCVIYQRTDRKKPKYISRIKHPTKNQYFTRSTKTDNKEQAIEDTRRWFYEIQTKIEHNIPVGSPTFERVCLEYIPLWKIRKKNRSSQYVNQNVSIIENDLIPFFGQEKIETIDSARVSAYFDSKLSEPKPPKGSTLFHRRTVLNHIFDYAIDKNYINKKPTIKLPSQTSTPRPHFEPRDYQKLTRYMWRNIDESYNDEIYRIRFYLRDFCLILANSGVRVGELRRLRWEDIEKVKDVLGNERLCLRVTGKTGTRDVIPMPNTETYLARLYDYRCKELNVKKLDLKELVFVKKDGTSLNNCRVSFNNMLRRANVLYDSKGNKRTLYSFRHSYITWRLNDGVSIYQIAANCGTSIEMIEKFYGKQQVRQKKVVSLLTETENVLQNQEVQRLPFL